MSDPAATQATWENRNFARAEGVWYLRHSSALARWPVIAEPWAQRIEARRLALESPDRGKSTQPYGSR